jgi:hypothetical protein
MIEEEFYMFPSAEQPEPRPNADLELEKKLYDLGFRPFGYEW